MSTLNKYRVCSKFYLKYIFMNESKKVLFLTNLKESCLKNIENMNSNLTLCNKYFNNELDDSFYANKTNPNIFQHLYINSQKSLNYNLCELSKINSLLLRLGH